MRINQVARRENCFFQTLLIIELKWPRAPMAYHRREQMKRLLIKIVRSFPKAKHPRWSEGSAGTFDLLQLHLLSY